MDNQHMTDKKYNDKVSFGKNIAEKHAIVFTVIFLIINIIITLLQLLPLEITNKVVRMNVLTVTNFVAGLLFLFVAYQADTINDIGLFSTKGISKGLLLGLPFIGFWIDCALTYASIWDRIRKLLEGYKVLFVILLVLSIGFNEELSMRGVILPVLLKYWNNKKYGVIYAVFLSSVEFGILHYFQWHENSFQTAIHIIRATMAGMFFATVFLLTRNIWSAIIVHALYDFLVYLRYFIFPTYAINYMSAARVINKILGASFPENGNTEWMISLIFDLPMFVAALIYLIIIIKTNKI